jgi:UDP-N-acetylglucosamine 4,6-dehydratase/5-epimerase
MMWKKHKSKPLKGNTGETFRGKDILVTGGCGSIGSEIVKQLLRYQPKRVRVFDNNESGLFYLQEKLQSPKIRVLVGDIRDKERLRLAVRGADIVFHAAALKHVPLCEYNPFEAVNTNVLGTQNLVEVTRDNQVKRLISISTDKAVNPINTMGATKLLAEKLVMTAAIGDHCVTKFSCVRFGNVLNSVGSVIPIFKRQIKNGGPVTITSPEMTRFFMSMSEAVDLVIRAAHLAKGQDIFILKMKRIRIVDLAKVMVEKMAPLFGYQPEEIKIEVTGVRPGEKIDEYLVTEEEKEDLTDLGELGVLRPPINLPYQNIARVKKSKNHRTNINDGRLLSKEEIRVLLDKYNLCEIKF